MPVSNELIIFLWSICGGIALGLVFDIFRIKRRIIKTGMILITFEDMLYWIIAAVLFFVTLYLSNEGQMRGFSIVGSILGAIFYLAAISPTVLKVSVAVIAAVKKCILFLVKIISWPFKLLAKLLKPIFQLIGKSVSSASEKCVNTVKTNTKSLVKKTVRKVNKKKRKKSIKSGKQEGI